MTETRGIVMNDDIFNDSYIVPSIVNGKIYLSEPEINFVMASYAVHSVGFDFKKGKTDDYFKAQRKLLGLKCWEQMTSIEQKQEYFSQLRKELEIASTIMEEGQRVQYLQSKSKDLTNPMRNFYIVALVKLGANISEDGTIHLSKELFEKLENWELRHKRLIDLVPINDLEQNRRLELREITPTLKLKPNYSSDF